MFPSAAAGIAAGAVSDWAYGGQDWREGGDIPVAAAATRAAMS